MLEIDFAEPKVSILKMLSTAFTTKDHTALNEYLVANGATSFYEKIVALGLLNFNQKLSKQIESSRENKLKNQKQEQK